MLRGYMICNSHCRQINILPPHILQYPGKDPGGWFGGSNRVSDKKPTEAGRTKLVQWINVSPSDRYFGNGQKRWKMFYWQIHPLQSINYETLDCLGGKEFEPPPPISLWVNMARLASTDPPLMTSQDGAGGSSGRLFCWPDSIESLYLLAK